MSTALAQGSSAALEIAASIHFMTSPQRKRSCRHAAVLNICSEDMQTYSAALYISPRAYLIVIAQILGPTASPISSISIG